MNIFINFYFVCNYIMNISFQSLDGVLQYFGRYYVYTLTILQIIYVLIFFGLVYINPMYLTTFNVLIQSFVCIFLLIRFHPYREHELRKYDSKIIFSSALFLLVNLGFVEIFRNIVKIDYISRINQRRIKMGHPEVSELNFRGHNLEDSKLDIQFQSSTV